MPELNQQSVSEFESAFHTWKKCFKGLRLRHPDQEGPDVELLEKRKKAKEKLEKAFKNMMEQNNK